MSRRDWETLAFFIHLTLQLSEHATGVQLSIGDCDPLVRHHERVVETALQFRFATAVLRSQELPAPRKIPCGFGVDQVTAWLESRQSI